MPSVARKDIRFKKQLVCYRILEETDHWSTDHQVDRAAKAAHCELDSIKSTKS